MRLLAVTLLILLLPAPALADEKQELPTGASETVDAALRALAVGDEQGFSALLSRDNPDPWLVAEGLLVRAAKKAAAQAARVHPRPLTAGLSAYVAKRVGAAKDAESWKLAETFGGAFSKGRREIPAGAARSPQADTVTEIALGYLRARSHMAGSLYERAVPVLAALAVRTRRIGWRRRLASVLYLQGMASYHLRRRQEAVGQWHECMQLQFALGRQADGAALATNLTIVLRELRRLDQAAAICAEARASLPEAGSETELLRIDNALGDACLQGGRPEQALAPLARALEVARRLRRQDLLFDQVLAMGRVHQERTSYAEARTLFEEAHKLAVGLKDDRRMALVETQLGYVALGLKDDARARQHLEQALVLHRKGHDQRQIGAALVNLSIVQGTMGRQEEALESLTQAAAILEKEGDLLNLGRALASIPRVLEQLGRPLESRPYLERALELAQQTGDSASLQGTHLSLSHLAQLEGNFDAALPHIEAAEREAESHGGWVYRLLALEARAAYERAAGRPKEAIRVALRAVTWVGQAARGHADRDAANVRTRFAQAFSVGAVCAHETNDHQALLTFLESTRALMLRESIAGGEAGRAAILAPALAVAEAAARQAESQERARFSEIVEHGQLGEVRRARKKLAAAHAAYDKIVDQIRREQRVAAGVLYPQPASLGALQTALPPGSVLVLLGSSVPPHPCVALLIRPDSVRSVALSTTAVLREAVAEMNWEDPAEMDAAALARLKNALTVPLQLGPGDRRVLISPADVLATVPWAALLPEKVIAFVPSASAWLASKQHPSRATGPILGIGDPDYGHRARTEVQEGFRNRGGHLTSLPFTRKEVTDIADIRLLGTEASEERLGMTLRSRPAWRAIHFACHGLIDGSDVMRSSLALTADTNNDGFLTVREVYRLPLHTRLVTLSACETGRGEAVWGEGMLGLAQAFMVAGASSVLCSLWKVDDEATRSLMVKFYELWTLSPGSGASENPKSSLGAAAALKAAQAYVRTHPEHPEWRHPYFWAAWVLWGLPE